MTANLEAFGLEIGEKERGTELALGRGVGAGAKDMYRLNVAGSRRAAVVGQSSVGRGLMFVCDATGAIKSAMFVPSGGAINIRNSAEIAIAAVKQGANGGELEITSSNGEPMVRAAVHQNGYGVVAAGPGAFRSGMGVLGLPGSFIVGKAR